MYSGTDPVLPMFTNELLLKIQDKTSCFPAFQQQVAYAVSCLEGDTYSRVQPTTTGTTIDMIDIVKVDTLVQLLEEAIGDPNMISTAQ